MKEYAFDAKLWASVRVKATSEAEARKKLINALDVLDINHEHDGVSIASVCIEDDSGTESELVAIDGEAI